jgi:hypothetical protein
MLYDVHLYRLYRVKQAGVEAETMEAAIATADNRSTGDAQCIEDAEDDTYSALVDVVGDENYMQTTMFDFIDGKPKPVKGGYDEAYKRALRFAQEIIASEGKPMPWSAVTALAHKVFEGIEQFTKDGEANDQA